MQLTYKCILILLFGFFLLLQPGDSSAQWLRTSGPHGGTVTSIAYLSPYLYASTYSGLFRSDDNGMNWEPIYGLPDNRLIGVVAKGGRLFICSFNLGIYVTIDQCLSWEKAAAEIPVTVGTGQYQKFFATDNYIYCSTIGGQNVDVYRSSDNGITWPTFYAGTVTNLVQYGDTIMLHGGSTGNQNLRSVDNGLTWSNLSLTGGEYIFGRFNNMWIALKHNNTPNYYYSTDGGNTFTAGTGPQPSIYDPVGMFNVGNKLYAIGTALYETSNGINWSMVNWSLLPPGSGDLYFGYVNGTDFWVGNSYNLTYSGDGGISYEERCKGIAIGDASVDILYNPGDSLVYLTRNKYEGVLTRTADHGNNWNEFASGLGAGGNNSKFIMNIGATYFASTDSGFYKSDNYGANWYEITNTNGLPNDGMLYMTKGNTELYAGFFSSGVYKSQDGGNTWLPANNGINTSKVVKLVWNQNKLFAGIYGAMGLCVSADSGATWTSLTGNSNIKNFNVIEDSIITYIPSGSQVIQSTDYGNTWDTLNVGGVCSSGKVEMLDTVFYVACNFGGVWTTNTSINYWYPINNGLPMYIPYPQPNCADLAIDSTYLYVIASGYGCWRLPLDSIILSGRLSGNIYWDKNSDGIKQANETFLNDEAVSVDPFGIAADTDTSGYYQYFYTGNNPSYILNFRPKQYWTVTSSPQIHQVTPQGNNADDLDFGINMIPGITDVKVDMGSNIHRPGFQTGYSVQVKNIGTDTISDVVTVTLDNQLTYISGTTPQNINGNTLTYAYTDLEPGESQNFFLFAELSSSTPIGTILNNSASVFPIAGDSVPINNIAYNFPIVTGSFDPNNKIVEPTGDIAHQDLLTYQINFQNTGTDTAFTVIVRDTISPLLDLNTFSLLAHSHPVTVTIRNGNLVDFRFDNIQLPDSNSNEPASHGLIRFSIRPVQGLSLNTTIFNSASIYFDFNAPVITNTISNTITGFTSVNDPANSSLLRVSINPNPFSSMTSIEISSDEPGPFQLSIFNSLGKLEEIKTIQAKVHSLDRIGLSGGVYFYEVKSKLGNRAIGKILVQ